MRDGNHNLKISLKTLSGFEYKPEVKNKSGSKLTVMDDNGNILHEGEFKSFTANFMRLLYGNMVGAGCLNGKSTTTRIETRILYNLKNGHCFIKQFKLSKISRVILFHFAPPFLTGQLEHEERIQEPQVTVVTVDMIAPPKS